VRTKFFSMVNLIAGRAVVPELIQDISRPSASPPKSKNFSLPPKKAKIEWKRCAVRWKKCGGSSAAWSR